MTKVFNIPHHKELNITDQHMLIVVDDKDYKPEVEETLKAIIKAIKKDFNKDVLLLLLASGQTISLGSQIQKFKDIIFFGVNPNRINLNINAKMYKIFTFENQVLFISHPLSLITKDVEKKKILWNLLQYQYLSKV